MKSVTLHLKTTIKQTNSNNKKQTNNSIKQEHIYLCSDVYAVL